MRLVLIFLVIGTNVASTLAQLQSPDQFLGYKLGDRFTRHHRMVEYFQHVDQQAANVKLVTYGKTYEQRPLIYAVVASPENFANLEQIRTDNLKRAGLLDGNPSTKIAIVWISYSVHGNEGSAMEAAIKTLYELANPGNTKANEWLKNTVVIIDPCLNPDGRDRFVNFFYQYGNQPPQRDPQAREHREPWPGGRPNHYQFDLNRDWAWMIQQESKDRIKAYNEWLPHVHADYHEQGYNSPYYFAPAAEPYHEVITPWQREFQDKVGKLSASYFDKQGWLYFTKERFDLYYPSYGDTYPTYSGAIGMTYEKGGIGAGLLVNTREGDPLTLADRVEHHYTTSMAAVEASAANAARLVDEFEKYNRDNINNPTAPYKAYIVKADNNPDKLKKLTDWLSAHSIRFGSVAARPAKGFDFRTQAQVAFNIGPGDLVISIHQPKGRFITTVFEPQSKLVDSATYDITAWNLLYGSGLKAYAVAEKVVPAQAWQPAATNTPALVEKPYAYLFPYQSMADVVFLGALMQRNIKVRATTVPITLQGQNFDAGTLLVTRRNNEGVVDFDTAVCQLAAAHQRRIYATSTGMADRGIDVGSGGVNFLQRPKVAVLGGDQTSSLSHGEVWHYFEQELRYPLAVVGTDYFRSINLWEYNVLVVPDGSYRLFDDTTIDMIGRWVDDGGKLILIANATRAFVDKKGFGLKVHASEDAKKAAEKSEKEQKEKEGPVKFGEAERKELSESIYGAIYRVQLDDTHPLAFGLGNTYFSLRTNELYYSFLDRGWNVGMLRGKQKPLAGFAGFKINRKLENSLVFGVEDKGKGQVIYFTDNPLFRSFWENGKMVFGNAVFMVGN